MGAPSLFLFFFFIFIKSSPHTWGCGAKHVRKRDHVMHPTFLCFARSKGPKEDFSSHLLMLRFGPKGT